MLVEPCPQCGQEPCIIHDLGVVDIICNDCYDGAPDSGPRPLVWWWTEKEAMEKWSDLCDEWEGPVQETK